MSKKIHFENPANPQKELPADGGSSFDEVITPRLAGFKP